MGDLRSLAARGQETHAQWGVGNPGNWVRRLETPNHQGLFGVCEVGMLRERRLFTVHCSLFASPFRVAWFGLFKERRRVLDSRAISAAQPADWKSGKRHPGMDFQDERCSLTTVRSPVGDLRSQAARGVETRAQRGIWSAAIHRRFEHAMADDWSSAAMNCRPGDNAGRLALRKR